MNNKNISNKYISNKNIKQNCYQEQVTHDTFINCLPLQDNKSIDIMWKYNNSEIFNKFTQFTEFKKDSFKLPEINKELSNHDDSRLKILKTREEDISNSIKIKDNSLSLPKITHFTQDNKATIYPHDSIDKEILQESIKNFTDNNCDIIDKPKKDTKKRTTVKETKDAKDAKKCENLSPLEFIMDHCSVNIISKDYIKQKLIETISRKDYNKIFGLKKSSEIMTGITKDKWNKSLASFMSFLSEKEILYKGDKILYNIK